MIRSSRKTVTEYFLMFWLVATTGIVFFYQSVEYIIFGFVVSAIVFHLRKCRYDKTFIVIISIFIFIELLQAFFLKYFNLTTFLGTYLRLFFAYQVVKILDYNFIKKYVKIIYFFSIISLFFYIFGIISPGFKDFILNNIAIYFKDPFLQNEKFNTGLHFIVYNYYGHSANIYNLLPRNSGPFWEPGAYGVFLMIALYFNYLTNRNILNKYSIVMIICLLTTFSTTSYITLLVFINVTLLDIETKKNRQIVLRVLFIPLFIAISLIMYNTLPFLKEKIDDQIYSTNYQSTSAGLSVSQLTRFGTAIRDLDGFSRMPITGSGRRLETKFSGYDYDDRYTHINNGLTNLLNTYGIIIFIVYFSFVYIGIKRISKSSLLGSGFLIILFILGFSQDIFLRNFFYSLIFLYSMKYNTPQLKGI